MSLWHLSMGCLKNQRDCSASQYIGIGTSGAMPARMGAIRGSGGGIARFLQRGHWGDRSSQDWQRPHRCAAEGMLPQHVLEQVAQPDQRGRVVAAGVLEGEQVAW